MGRWDGPELVAEVGQKRRSARPDVGANSRLGFQALSSVLAIVFSTFISPRIR